MMRSRSGRVCTRTCGINIQTWERFTFHSRWMTGLVANSTREDARIHRSHQQISPVVRPWQNAAVWNSLHYRGGTSACPTRRKLRSLASSFASHMERFGRVSLGCSGSFVFRQITFPVFLVPRIRFFTFQARGTLKTVPISLSSTHPHLSVLIQHSTRSIAVITRFFPQKVKRFPRHWAKLMRDGGSGAPFSTVVYTDVFSGGSRPSALGPVPRGVPFWITTGKAETSRLTSSESSPPIQKIQRRQIRRMESFSNLCSVSGVV